MEGRKLGTRAIAHIVARKTEAAGQEVDPRDVFKTEALVIKTGAINNIADDTVTTRHQIPLAWIANR